MTKNSIGLYRGDGLALLKNINGHRSGKIRQEFHQLFKESGLSLETKCNLNIVNYLDITLDLNTGTYKPYRKTNDEILYNYAKSNHPANIINQLPISIGNRLSNLSSNSGIFHEASKHYQNILNQSDMITNFNRSENKSKSSKNSKRNIVWFSCPFQKKSSTTSSKQPQISENVHQK